MIRRAMAKDLGRINDLLYQVLEVHAKGRGDIFISGTKKYSDEELLCMFENDQQPIFVYTDQEDVVQGYAFCIFQEVKDNPILHDMKTMYIDDICVEEKCRGQHIATQLYHYVRDYAKQQGCYRVTLNVWETNPTARKFYEAMGMEPLKTTMESIL